MGITLIAIAPHMARFASGGESYEQLETRLKTCGVSADLSEQIRKAIVRGCTWLTERQTKEGKWVERLPKEQEGGPTYAPKGVTALCALALRHSGLAAFQQAVRRGSAAAAAELGPEWKTYAEGLTAMLFMAPGTNQPLAFRISSELQSSLDHLTGWWGYENSGHAANLSTSQFAALGLWACHRTGAGAARPTWAAHLVALLQLQRRSGSWPYRPVRTKAGYPTGTFMGLANVLLARAALKAQIKSDHMLRRRVEACIRSGKRALVRDTDVVLKNPLAPSGLGAEYLDSAPWYAYYRLYALEKVAVFLGSETIGKRHWYIDGAKFLLGKQHADGSWGKASRNDGKPEQRGLGDTISTSFALLFLLRSSEVYRPTTPRSLASPPITGQGK
jgi:hypothetical protein